MIEFNSTNALQWSRLSSRKTFGTVLAEIAPLYPDLMVLAADVADSAGLSDFMQKYPNQFLNTGIAEQNMIGVAAGLAKEIGLVFAASFAPFASMRCYEMLRSYLGYMALNVKVVGLASGLSMGVGGNTHYGLEDLAITRTIPNLTVVSPADCTETAKAVLALADHTGPAYLRLTGVGGNPVVYKEDYVFELGKGIVLREGNDVAIIATGTMVNEAIRTARVLQKQGISCTIVDMHTIKPLDVKLLDQLFSSHALVVTLEEHSVIGGLGAAVAEYKAGISNSPRQIMIGLPDRFGKAGDYPWLLSQYGLTAKAIAEKIEKEWSNRSDPRNGGTNSEREKQAND